MKNDRGCGRLRVIAVPLGALVLVHAGAHHALRGPPCRLPRCHPEMISYPRRTERDGTA
jgi:hypothetical protein